MGNKFEEGVEWTNQAQNSVIVCSLVNCNESYVSKRG